MKKSRCKNDACYGWPKANGYCVTHNIGYDPTISRQCAVHDCVRGVGVAQGILCNQHAARAKRFGLDELTLVDCLLETDCAICGSAANRLVIDHDHACCPDLPACGKCFRGMICHHCNVALGMVRDSKGTLASMISYLSRG